MRLRRLLNWRAYGITLLRGVSALAFFGAVIWALGSEPAARALAQILTRISGGQIAISGVSGSLFDTLGIKRIDWVTPTKTVTLQQLELAWSPRQLWQHHQLQLNRLHIAALDITFKQPDNKPLQMPSSLALPFDLALPNARIDSVRIHHGDLNIIIRPVTFSLSYTDHRYQLQGTALSEWGSARVQTQLADQAPFKLDSRIGMALHDGLHNYDATTLLDGTLARIQLGSTASSGKAHATVHARLTPFLAQPLAQADIHVHDFNPADIGNTLPQALIDAQANITPTGADTYRGAIRFNNRAAGSFDRQKLPVTRLDADINGTTSYLTLSNIALLFGRDGHITGVGKWHDNGLDLHLNAQQLDLNALYQPLHPTHLNGKLDMSMNAQQQNLSASLSQADYNIDLAAFYRQQHLTITSAKLRTGPSALSFSGELALAGSRQFSAQGKLSRFNPARFGRYPAASINAEFTTKGQLQPQLQTRLQLAISNSRYNNAPLSGHAALLIAKQRVWDSHAQLQLGNNRLNLQGNFGAPHDRLTWQLDAPDIAVFGAGLGGKLNAAGTLHGSFEQPAGELNAQAAQLVTQSGLRIAEASARISIGQGDNGTVNATASLRGYQAGNMRVDSAYLHANGTRRNHALTLTARNRLLDLNATLNGGWRKPGWTGQITQLVNRGPYPLTLLAPAALTVSRGRTQLDHADFSFANGTLKLDQLAYGAAGISSRGSASGIDLGYIQQRLHPDNEIVNNLTAGGKWQFNLASRVDGEVMLWREQGDISFVGTRTTQLGIHRALLTLQAQNNQLSAKLDADGTTLGNLSAQFGTTLARRGNTLGLSRLAPLQAHAQLQIPSLAWTTAVLDDKFNLDGAAQGQIDVHGSLRDPVFSGTLDGTRLTMSYPEQGILLKDGTLHATFDQDGVSISQLDFHAGGTLNTHGTVKFKNGQPDMQLSATARQLNLVNRPDRQITLSGQAEVTARNRHLATQADIDIDRATIGLNEDATPQLSSDVIVLGRNTARSSARPNNKTVPGWVIDSQVKLNLGKHTRVTGKGVEARVEGTIRLDQHGTSLPAANGTLTVAEGSYTAFGQKLAITHGILNFAGIVDNPGVDILATRTYPTVTVGVQVDGTAQAPVVKLVSTPELNDSEKLSWLVLGHGTQVATNDADTKALQAAASYLLGKSSSVSLQSKLTQLTGLNEISLNGSGTLDSSVLNLGKRLSDQVYINYEQGLTGAKQLVKITYALSRRLSVRAQGGNESAVDLFYTFSFD
ncbi:hypothetical protein CAP31_12975 [Sulfuriferula sp. AH1]|uniref:translocation/assembly module TamB domain-containing protein n=1 Tax=Sulfuriferula sp. AH1 TaxID=1985873 RepID=UPI000B3B21AE|nr:translocation/assembly module TamB domain-containing protein [Sulfuriferula sp. AH1]ARU32511.1 hypothetical protein CAP31_12975 [Sulfuriferula sp. AH1]